MQYILSKEEYDELARQPKFEFSAKELQKFCTMVADKLVLEKGWSKGISWGCRLTHDDDWFCDECPSIKFCPSPRKSFSK